MLSQKRGREGEREKVRREEMERDGEKFIGRVYNSPQNLQENYRIRSQRVRELGLLHKTSEEKLMDSAGINQCLSSSFQNSSYKEMEPLSLAWVT